VTSRNLRWPAKGWLVQSRSPRSYARSEGRLVLVIMCEPQGQSVRRLAGRWGLRRQRILGKHESRPEWDGFRSVKWRRLARGNLAGLEATGADIDAHGGSVGGTRADALDVHIEPTARATVRVRNRVAEAWAFAADIAGGSHSGTPRLGHGLSTGLFRAPQW